MRTFTNYKTFDPQEVHFNLSNDRNGKTQIVMHVGVNLKDVGLVTPACITNWPRVTGDGNYGTMWGPTDPQKAKFTLDLTDAPIVEGCDRNENFCRLEEIMSAVDDRLLDFVQNNQLRVLGRKNLSRDEVKMLQIRSIRARYDKASGYLTGHSLQTSSSKYAYDGMGGKYPRTITICDKDGNVVENGNVQPGDVVAATLYANMVYTGVGGDKFGIHWSVEDVQVICQRNQIARKTHVPSFTDEYDFSQPYTQPRTHSEDVAQSMAMQFSEPMAVAV